MRSSVAKVGPFACLLATLAIVLLSHHAAGQAAADTGGPALGRVREVVSIVSLGDDNVREAVRERAETGPTLRSGVSVVVALLALAAAMRGPGLAGRTAAWVHERGAGGRLASARGRAPPWFPAD